MSDRSRHSDIDYNLLKCNVGFYIYYSICKCVLNGRSCRFALSIYVTYVDCELLKNIY